MQIKDFIEKVQDKLNNGKYFKYYLAYLPYFSIYKNEKDSKIHIYFTFFFDYLFEEANEYYQNYEIKEDNFKELTKDEWFSSIKEDLKQKLQLEIENNEKLYNSLIYEFNTNKGKFYKNNKGEYQMLIGLTISEDDDYYFVGIDKNHRFQLSTVLYKPLYFDAVNEETEKLSEYVSDYSEQILKKLNEELRYDLVFEYIFS